ncbi:mkrn1 [Symbiodinium sp. CCMP2592]|nr:mkrn1 [Symbiodinium sp. CCMP2592]
MKRRWEMPDTHWHEGKASRFPPNFVPRKMCTYMQNSGFCQKGDVCTFAHSLQELAPGPPGPPELQTASEAIELEDPHEIHNLVAGEELGVPVATEPAQELLGSDWPGSLEAPRMFQDDIRPTALCKMWIQHPTYCKHGDGCTFAHGLAEMSADVQSTLERIAFTGLLGTKFAEAAVGGDPHGKGKGGKGGKGNAQAVALYNSAANTAKGGQSGPTASNSYSGHGHSQTSAPVSRFEDSNFKPNKICSFWLKDPSACMKGDACSFAHGVLELHPNSVETCGVSRFLHSGFKPRVMCKNIQAGNYCLKGLWCTFAHSAEEML